MAGKALALALAVVAFQAAAADPAPAWACSKDAICMMPVGLSEVTPGQMLLLARDSKTGEGGWIAVDCVKRVAAVPDGTIPIADGSALAAACDTWGLEE